jgi:hypothetical protein
VSTDIQQLGFTDSHPPNYQPAGVWLQHGQKVGGCYYCMTLGKLRQVQNRQGERSSVIAYNHPDSPKEVILGPHYSHYNASH